MSLGIVVFNSALLTSAASAITFYTFPSSTDTRLSHAFSMALIINLFLLLINLLNE